MANLRADNLTGSGGRNAIDGSLYFDGTGDYLSIDDSADLELGSGDFTFEGWFYFGNTGSSGTTFWGKWNSPNRSYTFSYVKSTGTYTFGYSTDGSAEVLLTSASLSADINTWVHFAAVRNGSSLKVYRNGISIIDASVGSATFYNATTDLYIGRLQSNTNYDYKGYVSNFRLIKGTALYTANFTPPTEKLTVVPNTVLLCCQDSDNPLQEETGKTITAVGGLDINETEYVTNGTFGGSGTSPGGSTYSPAWTAWGDTTTAQNGGLFIERTSTLTGVYQLLTPTGSIPAGQYRIRGTISNKTGPGSAIIRLSSASQGNGTIFFGSYGPGVVESTVNYSGSGNLYLNLMLGNNTGSADFSNISFRKVFTATGVPKVFPPVGVDEGVTFEGDTKVNTQSYMYFPTGDTSQRGRGRGLYTLGYSHPSGGERSEIEYFNIQSQGNTIQFGNLTATKYNLGSGSSATRGVFCGGYDGTLSPSDTDIKNIDYVEIATTGNAKDFGDRTQVGRSIASASSATRVCMATAVTGAGYQATIDYITTATKGDAISFGSLGAARTSMCNASASPTRGIFAGGYEVSPVAASVNTMEYITMASTSSAVDFGDLTSAARDSYGGTASSNTRGCIVLANAPSLTALLNYVTIATRGDAAEFGNLTDGRDHLGSCSNSIRGVFIGGRTPNYTNIMDYITIASTGNAQDFGDISYAAGTSALGAALSDCHGGLS